MADAANNQTQEFVFRRLGEAFPLSGPDTPTWLAGGVAAVLFLLGGVSLVVPLVRFRAKSGSGLLGSLFGTVMTVLFGRVDTGSLTWWHLAAAGCRSLLYFIPLTCLGIARGFETDTEPLWYGFTGAMLLTASCLTVLMYIRDSGADRWAVLLLPISVLAVLAAVGAVTWATLGRWLKVYPLVLLRNAVLAILAFCFLLPAIQTWEDTEKRSRVVILLDVSPSVTAWSDDVSRAEGAKLKTRMDLILDALTDDGTQLLPNLLKKNPVYVYRFGTRLDEDSASPTSTATDATGKDEAKPWTRAEWEAFIRYDFKSYVLNWKGADGKATLSEDAKGKLTAATAWGNDPGTPEWAMIWMKAADADSGADALLPPDKEVLKAIKAKLDKRIDLAKAITLGTAMPDSITAAVNREAANMTQGIIVFSDGRSNLGSDSAFAELSRRAKEANIPVFTVGVGESRDIVSLTVSDLQVPDSTQPDEPTQITVAADGVGFKENEEVEVILELFLPGKDPKKDAADHEMRQPLKFAAGDPPHGEVNFTLDAEEFAKKGVMQLVEEAPPSKIGRKYVLKQGADKGAWQVRAKIARDKRELTRDEFHTSAVRPMQVIDKPLRVLIVTSGAGREYQTLRSLLVREMDQKRAEVCIYFQNEGGQAGTIVQDVPPGRLLPKFPDELDTTRKATAGGDAADATALMRTRFNNLDEFDVIVAFDPDWNEKDQGGGLRIPDGAFKKVKNWVENLGGGFVYVAGMFYTPQLVRTDDENGRLKPLLEIIPVFPDDAVLAKSKGIPRTYRRLTFNPPQDNELLRLDEDIPLPEADRTTAGWERYFTGRDKFAKSPVPGEDFAPRRGFLTYYPVKGMKAGKPLAEFIDVDEKGQPQPKPFYAVSQVGAGRSAWIGSPEIYRIRQTDVNYYDRFWLKLLRYAAAKRNSGAKSRGQVLMGKEFTSGGPIRVQTRVLQPSGEAYPEAELDKPKFTVKQFNADGNLVKEHGPFDVLKPTKLGAKFEGYYKGQVTADPKLFPVDGFRYRIAVTKSDLPEPLEADFILRSSNPELDNTKPDFAALTAAAGTLKEVTDRIADADARARVSGVFGGKDADPAKTRLSFKLSEKSKLSAVPDCIRSETRVQRNRGAVDDKWDDEIDPAAADTTRPLVDLLRREIAPPYIRLWVPVAVVCAALIGVAWVVRNMVSNPALGTVMTLLLLAIITLTAAVVYLGNPFPVGWVVAAGATLLCLEWLTRKLYRLA